MNTPTWLLKPNIDTSAFSAPAPPPALSKIRAVEDIVESILSRVPESREKCLAMCSLLWQAEESSDVAAALHRVRLEVEQLAYDISALCGSPHLTGRELWAKTRSVFRPVDTSAFS